MNSPLDHIRQQLFAHARAAQKHADAAQKYRNWAQQAIDPAERLQYADIARAEQAASAEEQRLALQCQEQLERGGM